MSGFSLKVLADMNQKSPFYLSKRVHSTWLFKLVSQLFPLSFQIIMKFIVPKKRDLTLVLFAVEVRNCIVGFDIFFIHLILILRLVLPPISTEGVAEESADIEKLANLCRDQMLAALKEITPARQIKNKTQ